MADRRADDRVPDDIPALLARELGDADIRAVTVRNLSEGGACAATRTPPAVGAEMYVGFFLRESGGLPLIARMRVVWTRPADPGHLVGLAFLAEGPAQRDAVERMRDYVVARRSDLFAAAV